jgi:hypothetical protein
MLYYPGSGYPGIPGGYPGYPGGTGGGGGYPGAPARTSNPPNITTTNLPRGANGTPYDQTITTSGGTAPLSFIVAAGALPPGIALGGATGRIYGTPTVAGTYTFILTVTDTLGLSGSASLTLVIPSIPSIANTSLPAGTVGIPYFASLTGAGGAIPYSFLVTAGGLPSGLVLATTGGITGIPTVAGSFQVTIEVFDANIPPGTNTSIFLIVISPKAISNAVTSMDDVVLIGSSDGAIYAIIPGRRHDENYAGLPQGFLQSWIGVPGSSPGLAIMQLGGASVSAKGNGLLVVTAKDDAGNISPLSTDARPMFLQPNTEVKRDFIAKAALHSERFGIAFTNGGVADSWFELHTAILWIRQIFSSRKA